ncbi:hypothetical protein Salat_2067200 [Sesamum alatum]|uniref:CCHC-type domain-containing protein n=1 Tax=Sesamum alatum TaxID=300844 RepID=A0AAE1Y0U0_9LAMI|nr:hypothetical protein Salat_2067200 [Sesamum alatum]
MVLGLGSAISLHHSLPTLIHYKWPPPLMPPGSSWLIWVILVLLVKVVIFVIRSFRGIQSFVALGPWNWGLGATDGLVSAWWFVSARYRILAPEPLSLSNFCHFCGNLGHIAKYCELQFEEGFVDPGSDSPYGPWLRAPLPSRGRGQPTRRDPSGILKINRNPGPSQPRATTIFGNFTGQARSVSTEQGETGAGRRDGLCVASFESFSPGRLGLQGRARSDEGVAPGTLAHGNRGWRTRLWIVLSRVTGHQWLLWTGVGMGLRQRKEQKLRLSLWPRLSRSSSLGRQCGK